MFCPKCGTNGYNRTTKAPEWRCKKCGHEWDSDKRPLTKPHSPSHYGGRVVEERDEVFSENWLH